MNVVSPSAAMRGVSEEEWRIRCDLAALYRLVAHFRMTDFIYTHISARLPGPDHHFLINKYGVLFHEMRASDLVKIDLEGKLQWKIGMPKESGFYDQPEDPKKKPEAHKKDG